MQQIVYNAPFMVDKNVHNIVLRFSYICTYDYFLQYLNILYITDICFLDLLVTERGLNLSDFVFYISRLCY